MSNILNSSQDLGGQPLGAHPNHNDLVYEKVPIYKGENCQQPPVPLALLQCIVAICVACTITHANNMRKPDTKGKRARIRTYCSSSQYLDCQLSYYRSSHRHKAHHNERAHDRIDNIVESHHS